MLPGITSALFGKGPPTFGVDEFTRSLMKFDGVYGSQLTINALTDYVKKTRVWTNTAAGNAASAQTFAGTGAYLTGAAGAYIYSPANETDYDIKPGQDFTIDFWAVCAVPTAASAGIIAKNNSGVGYSPFLFYQTTNVVQFYSSSNGATWDVSPAAGATVGPATNAAWHHYAVQRKGNVWSTWYDGVKQTEWTSALNPQVTTSPVAIGAYYGGTIPWNGYIDELRFSSCARYGANFTPQLFPYYGPLNGENDAATKLLLHFNSGIIDSAAGPAQGVPHPMTMNGTVTFVVGSPVDGGTGDTVAYFSGAQNTLVYTPWPNNIDTMPCNRDWTLDFWYYRISPGSGPLVAERTSNGTLATWLFYDNGGVFSMYASFDGATWGWSGIALATLATQQWYHIAVGNCGNAFRCYINGVKTHERAAGPFAAIGYGLAVGGASDAPGIQCYMDEVRFSDVARWTANFTPPNKPYGFDKSQFATKLLMHFDSTTNVTDSSMYRRGAATIGGTVNVTGAQIKFGDGSASFNGTNSCLQYPTSTDWDWSAGDYTIEAWVYVPAPPPAGSLGMIASHSGNTDYWLFGLDENRNAFISLYQGGVYNIAYGKVLVPLNTWVHIAGVRSGGNHTLYINGAGGAPVAIPAVGSTLTGILSIGAYFGSAHWFAGYIDELRISNGIARWTSDFTPPGGPYDERGNYTPGTPIVPPGPATHFSVTAPSSSPANTAFNVTVQALDANNKATTQYTGTVHFTSSDGSAVLPANSTLTSGTGTFSVTLKTGGNQTVTATDTVTGSITGVSAAIAVPLNATHFSVTAPASANVGVAISVTVQALDINNANTTNYFGTVHITSTDGAAVLPANSTLTNGAKTFSVTLNTAGTFTVTATDTVTGSITGTSAGIAATSSSPGSVTLTTGSSWTVPANFNRTNNSVECYGGGGGGGGGDGFVNEVDGGGGGGGAYSKITNIPLTGGAVVSYAIGGGGAGAPGNVNANSSPGGDTWFSSTSTVLAKGGGGSINGANDAGTATGGAGGNAASGVGTTKFSGGAGVNGQMTNSSGAGGGGCAGPSGNGSPGSYWNGGTGGGGLAGAGGGTGIPGAVGNNYGGGGTGGDYNGGTGGNGAQGVIKITWS